MRGFEVDLIAAMRQHANFLAYQHSGFLDGNLGTGFFQNGGTAMAQGDGHARPFGGDREALGAQIAQMTIEGMNSWFYSPEKHASFMLTL